MATAESGRPKIFIFVSQRWGEDYGMLAVAEDGTELASHVSSSPTWGRIDMGIGGTCQHDKYKAKYPNGYELVWVDDWKQNPILAKIAENNLAV